MLRRGSSMPVTPLRRYLLTVMLAMNVAVNFALFRICAGRLFIFIACGGCVTI